MRETQTKVPWSLLTLCAAALATWIPAQTGRTLSVVTSPGLGVTSSYTATYPPAAQGRLGFLLVSPPTPVVQPFVLPGFTSSGAVRVDLGAILSNQVFVLDASGSQVLSLPIPNNAVFQGFAVDLQTVDGDFAVADLAWGDNDLALTIGSGVVGLGQNLVPIPAGTFAMGSPVTPFNVAPYFNQQLSQPVHSVTITRPFWIGKYEVTQAEYQAVMGTNPSFFVGAQRPVEQVSWNNAMAYCAVLTASEAAAGRVPVGYQYRLPTEAEWEYCYRAGTTTEYWFGQTIACGQANFGLNIHTNSSCLINQTVNVGSYAANPWGLHDVAGNVWEWCLDSWDGFASYPSAAVSDPFVTSGPARVYRGGGWGSLSFYCRAAFRGDFNPGGTSIDLGFRVVLAPVLVP